MACAGCRGAIGPRRAMARLNSLAVSALLLPEGAAQAERGTMTEVVVS